MNQKIKAVVFDVGGVLCEWQEICNEFAREIKVNEESFLKIFIKHSFDPKTGSDLGLITTDEFFVRLTDDLGVPEKAKDWRRRFVPGFTRIEPTYVLVNELKGKYKLALLTNSKMDLWDEWKEGRLRENFPIIVDSAEVQAIKPDEKIFRILLGRLELKPEECLFIDDTKDYVQAAEKLGFKTIHFHEPEVSVKLIRKILYETI